MKSVVDLIPWKVTDISLRPYKAMWSFNPSIHFDGTTWRCILRCSDYAMPDGVEIKGAKARPGESRTKNAMVIFDPTSWRAIEIYKMREHDELPRVASQSVGYEDIRLFKTDKEGLQGIAAALHLRHDNGRTPKLAEQVLLWLSAEYDIVDARPFRGGTWSNVPQKNWVPFDRSAEPRFLYAIGAGTLFDDRGALRDEEALVRPALGTQPASGPEDHVRMRARERAQEARVPVDDRDRHRHAKHGRRHEKRRPEAIHASAVSVAPGCSDLRGGTQLVRIDDVTWLGLGHQMKFIDGRKYYWHVWYSVDARGRLKASSEPMKLALNGIEFAAGLAIDGDRVVVSFGVDDMTCKIGETSLAAVQEKLIVVTGAP